LNFGADETWPHRQLLITHRLRQRRSDLGLTQKEVVVRLARLGMHTTNRALSSVEQGAGLEIAKVPALAAALDCTVTYLVGLTDDPHRWEPDETLDEPHRPRAPVPSTHAVNPPMTQSLILGDDVPDPIPDLSREARSVRP
jgi:transcriptional regulator with XRE-family HTH domain